MGEGCEMTQYEQRKLLMEFFYQKPGLKVPELFEILDVPEIDVRNELKAL